MRNQHRYGRYPDRNGMRTDANEKGAVEKPLFSPDIQSVSLFLAVGTSSRFIRSKSISSPLILKNPGNVHSLRKPSFSYSRMAQAFGNCPCKTLLQSAGHSSSCPDRRQNRLLARMGCTGFCLGVFSGTLPPMRSVWDAAFPVFFRGKAPKCADERSNTARSRFPPSDSKSYGRPWIDPHS